MVKIESSELYHAEKEHISSTALRKMMISPRHFLNYLKNPREKSTSGQERGTFLHDLLLEQNVSQYVPRPLKPDNSLLPTSTLDYKAWLKTIDPSKKPIHPSDYYEMNNVLSAFVENKLAMKIYDSAKVENSVYAVDHDTGVKIKARPDLWGKGYIADLKSTGNIDSYFEKTIYQSGYDIQLAHYAETIFAATGEMINDFYIIAFELEAPFASKVFQIDRASMRLAREDFRRLLNQIKVCKEDDNYPSYPQEIIMTSRPAYMEARSEVTFEDVV